MASDLLATIRSEIEARLEELRPLLSEYERLRVAIDALVAPEAVAAPAPDALAATIPMPPAAPGDFAGGTTPDEIPEPTARGEAVATSSPDAGTATTSFDKPKRPASASVQQAIVAALGHGSHTLSELVTVTAMTGTEIRGGLRGLAGRRAVTKTKRDGKTAYALSRAATETTV